MSENIALRFALVAKLMRMRYGDSLVISGDDVMSAWPPTGDHDRSMEGAFRAMALSNGGNRPEESYTTEERIENDLDGSFKFDRQPFDRSYVFHRKVSACPKCRGEGRLRKFPDAPALYAGPADITDEVVNVTWETCDHKP